MKETRTFYTQFTKLSKEDIRSALMKLSEADCGFILKAHNGNLDGNRVALSSENEKKYYDIVYQIYEIIRMPKKTKASKKKIDKTLIHRFGCSIEEIRPAVNQLNPNYQSILRKAYGENLDGIYDKTKLSPIELSKINNIYVALKRKLQNPSPKTEVKTKKGNKDFYNHFAEYSELDVDNIFNQLGRDQREVIQKVYGISLRQSFCGDNLSKKEKKTLSSAFSCMNIKLRKVPKRSVKILQENIPVISKEGPVKKEKLPRGRKPKTLLELYKAYDFELIKDIIGTFKLEDQELIKKVYGDNLDGVKNISGLVDSERKRLNSLIYIRLKNKLMKPKNVPLNKTKIGSLEKSRKPVVCEKEKKFKGRKPKTVAELYKDYDFELIKEKIGVFQLEDQELIKKAYGESLEGVKDISGLSNSEKKRLDGLIYVRLKYQLEKSKTVSSGTIYAPKRNVKAVSVPKHTENVSSKRKEAVLTDNVANDLLDKISYKRMSLSEEIHLIKCSKLSFYDDATLEEREEYIKYFCEENPWFASQLSSATTEEERQLVILKGIEKSFQIRDEFIENFIMLVAKYARNRYFSGVSYEDLIQEGIMGIMKALEMYDVNRNIKFSTYASHWILQSIGRYIDNHETLIRIPVHQRDFIRKVLRKEKELTLQLGRKPTVGEIALALDVPVEKVELAKVNSYSIASLNTLVKEDGDTELGEFVEDPNSEYEDKVIGDLVNEEFKEIILSSDLSDREIDILLIRYGFYDDQCYTLEQIGNKFGLTCERIRQIELSALNKLRRDERLINFVQSSLDRKVYKKR